MTNIEEEFLSLRISLNSPDEIRSLVVSHADEYVGIIQQEDHWFASGAGGNGIFLRTQPRVAPPCLFSLRWSDHEGFLREQQNIQVLEMDGEDKPSLPKEIESLPVKGKIRRAREMWLKKNLRLYLDTIEEVGLYFYAEAIIDERHSLEECHDTLSSICTSFNISRTENLFQNYLVLQNEKNEDETRPGSALSEIREKNQEEINKRLERLRQIMDEEGE